MKEENLSSVENCMKREIDQLLESQQKIVQSLKSTGMMGGGSIEQMKQLMSNEMEAKKKTGELEEKLGKRFEMLNGLDENKNQVQSEARDAHVFEVEEEENSEEDGTAGKVVLPESCFQRTGLRKLSFYSNNAEPEVETPKLKRQATVGQDGIIEPASDSDSDSDTEEEEDVEEEVEETEEETEEGEAVSGEVCPGIKFPEFSPGQQLRCNIVAMVSPEELWVREEERTQEYYGTYHSLQTIFSLLDLETRPSWTAGSSCAVKTREKGWVRAVVLAVEGQDVRLLLGDIGQVVTMAREDLQPLQVEFTQEPFFCFRVKVPGIVPAGSSSRLTAPWSGEARTVMEERGHQSLIVEVSRSPGCCSSLM